jgi:hypothetical protein
MLSAHAQLDLDTEIWEARKTNTVADTAAAWEFARESITSTLKFGATLFAAQAETDLREENTPATDSLRAGLNHTWQAVTDRPADRYFAHREQIEQQAVAYEQANDPISARKVRTKLDLETGAALLGMYGAARYLARNTGRAITRTNGSSAATVVEGADGTPAFNPSGGKTLAQFFDDPQAGHVLARERIDGGDGRSLSGHGQRDYPMGQFQIPEGTAVTQLRSNVLLSDDIALKIEAGSWDELAQDFASKPRYQDELSGMYTALPGSSMPDYTWLPPTYKQLDPLTIHRNSVTTGAPRRLSDTLQPNMGCINFVACTVFKDENFGD